MINEMHLLLQDLAMPYRVRNKDRRLDDRFIPYLQWFASAVVVVAAAVVVSYSLFYQNRSISALIVMKETLAQKK
jgi:hypothetical protein